MRQILDGVRCFHRRVFAPRRAFFEALGCGQKPLACLITCADSRIDPQLLTGCETGELFVIRNAGNLVPPYGTDNNGEAAAVELAIDLGVRDLIVCGHSHCGAMEKLLSGSHDEPPSLLTHWLRHADETKRRLAAGSAARAGSDTIWHAVEQNVLVQLEHLRGIPAVAEALEVGRLRLHGWVYRIETGEVFAHSQRLARFAPVGRERAARDEWAA